MTDEDLMKEVKSGRTEALGHLYERYKKVLYTYALYQLQDRFKAEDTVHNTFVNILKHAGHYKDDSSFKAWTYTICRNLVKDQFRKMKADRTIRPVDFRDHSLTGNGKAPDQLLSEQDDRQVLNTLLMSLDKEKREILTLVKLHGMRYKEVAEILGKEEGHLRIIVFRTIKELQQRVTRLKNDKVT